ncbi:MAG: helix-hairpin-helix domain-containing protein [Candidatus Poribacteria bacterium]
MLTNEELAAEFRILADLMTIGGDDVYRIRRYSRLADDIDDMSEPIDTVYAEGRLTDLKGVGKSTADLIGEYLTTGTSERRAKLEETTPITVLDLLELPGIGPKTAQRLFQELHIKSIDELEAGLDAGTVQGMKGITSKSEEKIRGGIARIRRRNVERPLQEVRRLSEQICEALNLAPEVSAVAIAGAARRGVEMPKRIQVVAATENIGHATGVLSKIGLGDGAPAREVRGEFGGGFPIVTSLTPSAYFGVTWLRETADAEHVAALDTRAVDRDLAPLSDDDAWKGLDEEEIYEKLGLPLLTPELREGAEAIHRADAGSLPTLVQIDDYNADLHSHTHASDGANTIEEMAEAARARGYGCLAICDHSRSSGQAGGLSVERLLEQIDKVRAVNDSMGDDFTVLAGSEVDILRDGKLDYPDEVLAQLDWVVASVHSNFNLSEAAQTERFLAAMENPYVRVVGHPTGRLLSRRDPYPLDIDALIAKAVETGVALELNSAPDRLDLKAEYCAMARDAGVPISINTDAHRRESFDSILYGLATARRAWLEPKHVLNTWSVGDIRAFRAPA